MRKYIATLIFCSLLLIATVNCQRQNARSRTDSSSVTVLYPWDERVLSPFFDVDAKFLVFLPLFTNDENGLVRGILAEKWEHSADYRTWTYYLRKDVQWHDGVMVTAHDIEFTLELIAHPDILFSGDVWLGLQSIKIHDDHSITLSFESPMDFQGDWLVYWPKHLLENLDPKKFWEWEFWLHPVGNGPYRYVRHVPKTLMEFEANTDYFNGKPSIDRVLLKFSSATPLIELMSGNVDIVTFFNRSDIPKLARIPHFRTYYSHYGFSWLSAIHWNLKDPILTDRKVRRALTLAIDREEILRALNMPEELKIFDVVFSEHQYRLGKVPIPLPYDQEAAVRLLEEAGWKTDNEGNRIKDGMKLEFEMIVPQGSGALGAYREAAILIQNKLRQIGIQMNIQVLEETLFRKKLRSGQFQAAINRFFQGSNALLQWIGKNSPLGYNNPRVVQLLTERYQTVDPEEVDRILCEMQPIMAEDLPLTFLFPQIYTAVVHKRIHGLSSPYRADPIRFMEHLWIEED